MSEKPILIVGRSGQLAFELSKHFSTSGIAFKAYGRPDIDVSIEGSVAKAIDRTDAGLVINAAAYTAVDLAEAEPELAFATNGEGTQHIAEACKQRGLPLVHVSTDYVFNGKAAEPYSEEAVVDPIGIYGRSKLAGERALLESGCKGIILRTAWVYSAHGKNFVKTMLRLAQSRDHISVVDDQIGTPTSSAHLAQAIGALVSAIDAEEASPAFTSPWGIYHCAGLGSASWADVARKVFEVSHRLGGPTAKVIDIPSSDYPSPVTRPANSKLDCRKLRQRFGISLPHWSQGIGEVVSELVDEIERSNS